VAVSLNVVWHVLLALTAVVVLGRMLATVCRAVGQPPVIGEVVAGILLGPSALGATFPDVAAFLLPESIEPTLSVLAQIGVVAYMFLVGVELNPALIRGLVRTALTVSCASVALPFMCGAGLALYLYPRFSTTAVPILNFGLFIGIATSITAFPVLARILSDRGLTHTPLGALALTCAALSDVAAWCLLAFVVGVVRGSSLHAAWVAVLTVGFVATMVFVVRPWIARLSGASAGSVATVLVALVVSALATEAIGIHAIFGAFVLGVLIPHDSPLARTLSGGVARLATVLLLPAFFAVTGMRTEIGTLAGAEAWLACALVVAVATVGKCGGTAVAARVMGLSWRHAGALGAMMNTRGLMELIVLGVGLDLGVISPALFTMFVVMALVTTAATAPALSVLLPPGSGDIGPAAGEI
jgi:Kef-type K+ transport system membrane component KefB